MAETQVGIIGAGPAGLMLGHLLHLSGISSVVLERQDRAYVEARVRAGVLEQGTADLLVRCGVGDRMQSQGLVHHGLNLQFSGKRQRFDLTELSGGRSITVYGQQEVVKDLIAARLAAGLDLQFALDVVALEGLDTDHPVIRYRPRGGGEEVALRCDVVAGCDGSHGFSRQAIPRGALCEFDQDYPYGWLGILAAVAPSSEELVYAYHERGFALHSQRSPQLSRLYLQVDPDEDLANWPDDRIWEELQVRLRSDGWSLAEGPVLEKGITAMRSHVVEPMQHGRLFLAGDAAHIVPPTGAKGMNLAIADVVVLAEAVDRWYRSGDDEALRRYSERCLKRVWRVQDFSSWMTTLLHRQPDQSPFAARVQQARQEYLCQSTAMARSLAENYVGWVAP
ncbi:MAG: 4-hydroxybenzoate 3-monooxygenase [Acidimicrobiales bacterium]|nr:4-hydroxybenzoate 3-monooxygenase [Acidimicrobiales bacterium]